MTRYQVAVLMEDWWYTTVDPGYTGDTVCV
jgi:hypothetical protein